MSWKPETVHIATHHGAVPRAGYVYRGLGLWQMHGQSPKGRRPAEWDLLHLNTGLTLARLKGSVAEVFPIATEVAEAGDWTFDGPYGWKNQFPDASQKVREIIGRHQKRAKVTSGPAVEGTERAARAVLAIREGGLAVLNG